MGQEGAQVKGTLRLEGIVLRVRLGAEDHERIASRDVPVDVEWKGEFEDGIPMDYTDVCRSIAVLEEGEYRYIEDLSRELLGLLGREFRTGKWTVTVRKPFPPSPLRMESASFTAEAGGNG